MKFQKGNKLGGRRPKQEENAKDQEQMIELITNEALIEFAKNKVMAQLRQVSNSKKSWKKIKEMALPLALKAIKQTSSVEVSEVKPLLSAIRGSKTAEDNVIKDLIEKVEESRESKESVIESGS
jgi:hypothetical protein